jgi:hypothetical protein
MYTCIKFFSEMLIIFFIIFNSIFFFVIILPLSFEFTITILYFLLVSILFGFYSFTITLVILELTLISVSIGILNFSSPFKWCVKFITSIQKILFLIGGYILQIPFFFSHIFLNLYERLLFSHFFLRFVAILQSLII